MKRIFFAGALPVLLLVLMPWNQHPKVRDISVEREACQPSIVELPIDRSEMPPDVVVQVLVAGCDQELDALQDSQIQAIADEALSRLQAGYHLTILNDPKLRRLSARQISSRATGKEVLTDIHYYISSVPSSQD